METDNNYPRYSPPTGKNDSSLSKIDPAHLDSSEGQSIDLGWLFSVIRRRLPIMAAAAIALGAVSGSAIIWKSKKTAPVYEGSFKVLVEPVTAEGRLAKLSLLAQTGNSTGAEAIPKLGIDNSDLVDYETQIRVMTSPKLMEPVVKQLQARYPKITYNNLMERLAISRVSYDKDGKQAGTKILEVRYLEKDPEQINFVLNQLANTYLKYSLQERLTSLNQGITFIDLQLPELRQRVDVLQGQMQKLRQDYTLNAPDITGKYLTEQAQNLELQQAGIQSELAERRAIYNTLVSQMRSGDVTSILGKARGDKVYQTVINQLQGVEGEIADQSSQFKEDSPPMAVLREKQQNLQAMLVKDATLVLNDYEGQIRELEARSAAIAKTQQELARKQELYPVVLRRYTDLDRELGVSTDSLRQFLEKKESLKLDASQREIPWELIAPPEIPRNQYGQLVPASAKQTSRHLAIVAVLSVLVGIGIGFVAEILHTVFHTPEEVKAATKLPLIGVIPYAKQLKRSERKARRLASSANPIESDGTWEASSDRNPIQSNAAFLEAFRSLYTNIRLLSSGRPIHSLVVGSAVPVDGKTTVAIHLAQTAAAIGQRVLLVDADLRRPQLHLRLGLSNSRGLSEAIATDMSLNDAIQRSRDEENLFVLTAGQVSEDPIKLLSSDKMQYLMEQFQAFFDLVIYDTPPLVGLADGNIIAAHTDKVVLVVGLEKTDRSLLTKALDGLKISGASVLGIIANGLKGLSLIHI